MTSRKFHVFACSHILGRFLHALVLFTVVQSECNIFTSEPPAFSQHPEDQFVFEVDENGDPVTLTLTCPVTGTEPIFIEWYRSGMLDDDYTTDDGLFVLPNINATHEEYASAEGVEYYCTAENCLGTIRSPTVKAFYAVFTGFVQGLPPNQSIDVIDCQTDGLDGCDQTVALKCAVNPGSNPKPNIEWLMIDSEGTETVLEKSHRVRFIDDGEWVILTTDTEAIEGKTYQCQVTNKDYFLTERAPNNYTLNPVTEFDPQSDEVRVYKPLTNKTVLKTSDEVLFGTGLASFVFYLWEWTVDGSSLGVSPDGVVVSITPSALSNEVRNPHEVKLCTSHDPAIALVAYLYLLEPAIITSHPSHMRDVLSGNALTFTCGTSGSPTPEISWLLNGEVLATDGRRIINGGTLTITSSATTDSGMYQCIADNPSGSDSASWTAQIRDSGIPTVIDSQSYVVPPSPSINIPVIQRDTGPVELGVTLNADPCPTVEWFRDGVLLTEESAKPMDNTSNITLFTFTDGCVGYQLGDNQFRFVLTVNVLNSETIGFYSVTFTNPGGSRTIDNHLVTRGVFAGFVEEGEETRMVEVIDADVSERDQSVALRCTLKPGSVPIPRIEWVQESGGTISVLEEMITENHVRIGFLDSKEWIILHTSTDVISKDYFCRVRFPDDEMWVVLDGTDYHVASDERSPITYSLNSVTQFSDYDGVRVYKNLTDKRAPILTLDPVDVPDDDRVYFGSAFAFNGEYIRQWRINGKVDERMNDMGTIISVAPVFLSNDVTNPLDIVLHLVPSNMSLQRMELYATLLLEYEPQITVRPRPVVQYTLTGDSKTFTCEADGGPTPTFTWTFNGASFAGDDLRVIGGVSGGTLQISSTRLEHTGEYSCIASNGVGTPASASVTLNVRDTIAINITSSYKVNPHPCAGQRELTITELVVQLTADPCPKAEWFRNNELISSSNENITLMNGCKGFTVGQTEFTFKLMIVNLNAYTVGEYRVVFTNANGTASIDPHIISSRVNPTITGLSLSPDIPIPGTSEHCLTIDSTSTLTCGYNAFPHGTVEFIKNNGHVVPDERITQICNVLTITGVTEEDEGRYKCRVQNDVANASSVELILEKCSRPAFVEDLKFTNNMPRLNTQARATCRWIGIPKPSITWSKGNNDLRSSERLTITERQQGSGIYISELVIRELTEQDSGTYQCSITNIVDSASSSGNLKVFRSSAVSLQMSPIGTLIAVGLSLIGVYITYG